MNKKVIVSALVLTITGAGLLGVNSVSAQSSEKPYESLVQKIADKFNLKKDDVQAVFEQDRSERHAKMEEMFATRLDQLVKDGKITEAQKTLILNKHKELREKKQTLFESLKDKTDGERKELMQSQKEELDRWAKQNGIDPQYLFGGHGMKHRVFMMHKN